MPGGQSSSSTNQSSPTVPPWLLPLLQREAGQWFKALGPNSGVPSLSQMYAGVPEMNTPGMTADLASAVSGAEGFNALNPYTSQGAAGLSQFIGGGPGTPSEATNAALKEFQDLQAPEILQQSVLMGGGNSGAALQALTQGQESALVPFMQQDLQNQLAASGQLAGIGQNQSQLGMEATMNALQAAGIPYNIALQQAQDLYNKQEQQFQFAQNLHGQPFSLLGSAIGGGSSTTVNTPSKF